jgi:acyl-CoA synthetase (AMP-forming)/AMP-acid ligase II
VIDAQGLTLGDISREHRRRFGDRTAVVCGATRLTYAELDERASRVASMLRERGCRPGSLVVWLGQNCHKVMELLLGCAKVGAVLCPLNWRGSAAEMAFALEDLGPSVVVWQAEEIGARVAEVRSAMSALCAADGTATVWLQHDTDSDDGYDAAVDRADAADPEVVVDPGSATLIIYTAAFEGQPNAAALNHVNLIVRALCEAMWNGIDHEYAYLNNGPVFHIGNWRTMMPTFLLGGKNVFIRRVETAEMLRLIEGERCSGAYLVPVTRQQLEEANAVVGRDLSSLRDGQGSERWRAMVSPATTFTGYGQTETGGLVTTTAFGPSAHGAGGRSLPLSQVRIVDVDGHEVFAGGVGEIVVRGLTVMNGYLGRGALNDHRFRGGWWHTGDLGQREADGSITFVGPMQRMLKSANENIYPVEVERCLRTHRAVADCAVIGVPDPVWHQSVKALVVIAAGSQVTEQELIEHCRDRIASYKKPRVVEFVAELPRRNGAVDYAALDLAFGGGGYPGTSTSSEGSGAVR